MLEGSNRISLSLRLSWLFALYFSPFLRVRAPPAFVCAVECFFLLTFSLIQFIWVDIFAQIHCCQTLVSSLSHWIVPGQVLDLATYTFVHSLYFFGFCCMSAFHLPTNSIQCWQIQFIASRKKKFSWIVPCLSSVLLSR